MPTEHVVLCSLTGYDACGHMSEETVAADKTAALGIVLAVGCSAIAGLMYILALMFSVQVSSQTGDQVTFIFVPGIQMR